MVKKIMQDLAQYREDVLLASAGALLHNLGKVSSVFVQSMLNRGSLCYFFQQVVGLIREVDCPSLDCSGLPKEKGFGGPDDCTLTVLQPDTRHKLAQPLIQLPPPLNDRTYRLGDLLEYLGVGHDWQFLYEADQNGRFGIEQLRGSTSYLTHLMNACHGGVSGSEKDSI
ncbi:MAG TPA: hypothetical protein GXX50_10435, partial [Firmicutes bacterium]|nr:hypothetical protein [Bacillota bacterium]